MFSFVIGKLLIYVGHVKNLMAMISSLYNHVLQKNLSLWLLTFLCSFPKSIEFFAMVLQKTNTRRLKVNIFFSLKSKTKKRIYVYLLFFSLRHLPLVPCSFFYFTFLLPLSISTPHSPTSFPFPSPLLIPFHLLSSLPFATPPHLLHGISSPSPSPLPPLKKQAKTGHLVALPAHLPTFPSHLREPNVDSR